MLYLNQSLIERYELLTVIHHITSLLQFGNCMLDKIRSSLL